MKIKDNNYVILFLRVCMLTPEEVLAELWILENDDPLGNGAQIVFNRVVTESINCNCTRIVAVCV